MQLNERKLLLAKKHALRFGIAFLRLALFTTLAFVVIYPVLTRVCASFMSVSDVFDMSVQYVPKKFTLSNYSDMWEQLGLAKSYVWTIQYTLTVALLQTASATAVGYGLARFKFPFNKPLFMMALVSLAIPPTLMLIPLYKIFSAFDFFGLFPIIAGKHLNLLNTQWCNIILSVTAAGYRCGLYIVLMRQYFRGVPKELEEAAYIDGAGTFRTFLSVMLPNARTMMITVGLFSFVWTWLDSDFAPTMMYDTPLLNIRLDFIASILKDKANVDVLSSLYADAGVIFLILPLLILYLFTQKYFVQSMERSGLVG